MKVTILSDTLVRVSWSLVGLQNISEISVYYRQRDDDGDHEEMSTTVSSFTSFVVLTLDTGRQYIIEVSANIILNGNTVSGYRTSYGPIAMFLRNNQNFNRECLICSPLKFFIYTM